MEEGQLIGLGEGGGYDYSNERDQGYCPDFDSDDQGEGYSGDEADLGPREGHFLTADGRSFHVCAAGLMHAHRPSFYSCSTARLLQDDMDDDFDLGNELVDAPRSVGKVLIGYARTAKKVRR
jgi:hypothetical protein